MTVPVILVTPYQDPPNTFRATSITDMFRVVPAPDKYWKDLDSLGASFIYDVGLGPEVRSLIFTFQNRTVSHTLRVTLTLPPYLRSDIGNVFDVPRIMDTTTPPVVVPDDLPEGVRFYPIIVPETFAPIEGSGKGIINVWISFSEEQAKTYIPGTFEEAIIVDVVPLNVNGPVFVDETAVDPIDLNEKLEEGDTVPRDDDVITPPDEEPTDEAELEVPVFIDRDVEVPVEVIKWIDGTDGQSKDWPPPAGWQAGNDGRMYPPIIESECEVITGTERNVEDIPEDQRTPLEQLLFESLGIAPTFGGATQRRGYVIDLDPLLSGFNTSRVTGRTIELLIGDSKKDGIGFKIINWKKTFKNGETVPPPSNSEIRQLFEKTELYTGHLKEGVIVPGGIFSPDRLVSLSIKKLLDENKKLYVAEDADEGDLRRIRIWGTTMALVKDIEANGEGKPV